MFHIILIFNITIKILKYRVIGRLHETTFTNDLVQGLIAKHIDGAWLKILTIVSYFSNKICVKELLRH